MVPLFFMIGVIRMFSCQARGSGMCSTYLASLGFILARVYFAAFVVCEFGLMGVRISCTFGPDGMKSIFMSSG